MEVWEILPLSQVLQDTGPRGSLEDTSNTRSLCAALSSEISRWQDSLSFSFLLKWIFQFSVPKANPENNPY